MQFPFKPMLTREKTNTWARLLAMGLDLGLLVRKSGYIQHIYIHAYTYTHVYVYMCIYKYVLCIMHYIHLYIYMCVYTCVLCVFVGMHYVYIHPYTCNQHSCIYYIHIHVCLYMYCTYTHKYV